MRRTLFGDEHQWFRETVRGFVRDTVRPTAERARQEKLVGRDVWGEAGRLGLLGLGVPGEHGGSDTSDFRFNVVLNEELAAVSMAHAASLTMHTDIVAPYLVELTTPEQRERWLPDFCTGERITAIGMTEPEAGSDLAGIRTTARRDGDEWVINGSKTFITNGSCADLVVLAARTGDARSSITMFGVEATADGFSRGRKLEKVGQPEADTAELFLEDVRVTDDFVIGKVDGGFAHMMARLAQERLSVAVTCLAHAQRALDLTLEYVKTRNAFGRPVGSFQNSRFLLAELTTELDVTRAFVDRCVEAHVARDFDAVSGAQAKLVATEVQNRVLDGCVQLHGGYGYMNEYEVARSWTDARVTRIYAGTNEIMKEIVGRSLGLGDPRPAS